MSVRWAKMIDDLSMLDGAAKDGFESVQAAVGLVMEMKELQIKELRAKLNNIGLAVEVWADPLPSEVRVTEKGFNLYVWTEYLKKAVQRIAELGCHKLAWSDGRARVLPWEGDVFGMKEQMLQFLTMFCDVARAEGVVVMLEPLGPRRTNYLNTMEEMADFIALVNRENLSSMISLRELGEIKMAESDLPRYSRLISHVQVENPLYIGGRRICPKPSDGHDYRPFFQALHSIRYDGVIALPQDADEDSLRFCQGLLGQS